MNSLSSCKRKRCRLKTICFAFLSGLAFLAGCSNSDSPQSQLSINVEEFNAKIISQRDEEWTRSPLQVSLKFLGEDRDIGRRTIELVRTDDSNEVFLVVTDQELPDDSVEGFRHEFVLRQESQGYWSLQKVEKPWKCKQGRGHLNYSCESRE